MTVKQNDRKTDRLKTVYPPPLNYVCRRYSDAEQLHFHKSFIPYDLLERLISCVTLIDVKQLYSLWALSFNYLEKSDICLKFYIFNFGWLFTALQVSICTKGLN